MSFNRFDIKYSLVTPELPILGDAQSCPILKKIIFILLKKVS